MHGLVDWPRGDRDGGRGYPHGTQRHDLPASKGLSENLSRFLYPFIVPFTGLLGAVLTGSNNNSNVLFGVMHMETARIMGLSIPLILAAQSAGGSLGSVCAPAKVIVGCTTVGLSGQEGRVLQKLLPLMMIPTAIVGLAAVIWVYLIYQGYCHEASPCPFSFRLRLLVLALELILPFGIYFALLAEWMPWHWSFYFHGSGIVLEVILS